MGLFGNFKKSRAEKRLRSQMSDAVIGLFSSPEECKKILTSNQEITGGRLTDEKFRKIVISTRFLEQNNNWPRDKIVNKIMRNSEGVLSAEQAEMFYELCVRSSPRVW